MISSVRSERAQRNFHSQTTEARGKQGFFLELKEKHSTPEFHKAAHNRMTRSDPLENILPWVIG